MMQALKEWASVVRALECGDQTVLLRKGGILETTSGFKIESKKFLLFPTFEHQELKYVKPKFHNYIEQVKNESKKEGFNNITSYAEVLEEADVDIPEKIEFLSPFHIWSDEYIQERRNWMPEKPMKVVFLRVFKVDKKEIPIETEYHGCKSWININEDFPFGSAVLNDDEVNSKLEKFKEAIK